MYFFTNVFLLYLKITFFFIKYYIKTIVVKINRIFKMNDKY